MVFGSCSFAIRATVSSADTWSDSKGNTASVDAMNHRVGLRIITADSLIAPSARQRRVYARMARSCIALSACQADATILTQIVRESFRNAVVGITDAPQLMWIHHLLPGAEDQATHVILPCDLVDGRP